MQNDPVNFTDPTGLDDSLAGCREVAPGEWDCGDVIDISTSVPRWDPMDALYDLMRGPGNGRRVMPEMPADNGGFSRLDGLQTGLDVVGLIPVVGEPADLVNACISVGRGDYTGAALSAAGAIPFVGWGATAAKFGRKGAHIWTATKKQSHVQNAFRHFKDHGAEFGAVNSLDYVRRAHSFLNNSPAGTLTKTRPNGDVLKYHPGSNTFGIMDKCGQPRTMFKPDDGIDYWNRQ